jgi:hypothetical protein
VTYRVAVTKGNMRRTLHLGDDLFGKAFHVRPDHMRSVTRRAEASSVELRDRTQAAIYAPDHGLL